MGSIAEEIRSFMERVFGAFNFIPSGANREEQVRRLADEVIPLVREEATQV